MNKKLVFVIYKSVGAQATNPDHLLSLLHSHNHNRDTSLIYCNDSMTTTVT